MFKNWHEVYKLAKSSKVLGETLTFENKEPHASIEELSYSEVKNSAKKYQVAKLIVIFFLPIFIENKQNINSLLFFNSKLYEAFKQNHLGLWLTKPFEQDSFLL
jgi:hypothetical protein